MIYQDYREIILNEFPDSKEEWEAGENILYKTLVFELSPATHVEKYECAQKDFKEYCENYKEEYATADIMNGWWGPFKYIFNLTSRKDKTALENIRDYVKGRKEEEIIEKYSEEIQGLCSANIENKKETIKSLLEFLRVVYTAGNITPAPINPKADALDSWEYKLEKYKAMYHDRKGDRDILLFHDYKPEKWTTADFREKPWEYLESRIALINNRNKMIFERQDT